MAGEAEVDSEKILDSLTSWLQTDTITKLMDATRDCEKWEGMMAYASHYST